MTHRFRAPGKTMWLGEYVVLDGAPALVSAVDRHAQCTISPPPWFCPRAIDVHTSLDIRHWRLRDRRGRIHPPPSPVFALIEAVRCTLEDADIPLPDAGCTLRFSTEALSEDTKLGLGSSAAIAATATIALMHPDRRQTLDLTQCYALARRAHARFQGGTGSGADVAAACLGGVLKIQQSEAPQSIDGPFPCTIAAYTGKSAHTRTLVEAVRRASSQRSVASCLRQMAQCATQGARELERHNHEGFLDAVHNFHHAERELTHASGVPIVTDDIEAIVEHIDRSGGAGKASGAGGGDIVIGFFQTARAQQAARNRIKQDGYQRIPLAIEARGVLKDFRSNP